MEEIWKSIKDYEGVYEVSSIGNVRRVGGSVLKPLMRHGGYLQVQLCKEGKRHTYKIHRLVARAFPEICGEWYDGCDINHKDETPSNNAAENLEICNRTYNNNYGHRKEKDAKAKAKPVLQYSLDNTFIREWDGGAMEIQRVLGIDHSAISKCCYGKYKQYYGYIFKFKECPALNNNEENA